MSVSNQDRVWRYQKGGFEISLIKCGLSIVLVQKIGYQQWNTCRLPKMEGAPNHPRFYEYSIEPMVLGIDHFKHLPYEGFLHKVWRQTGIAVIGLMDHHTTICRVALQDVGITRCLVFNLCLG